MKHYDEEEMYAMSEKELRQLVAEGKKLEGSAYGCDHDGAIRSNAAKAADLLERYKRQEYYQNLVCYWS